MLNDVILDEQSFGLVGGGSGKLLEYNVRNDLGVIGENKVDSKGVSGKVETWLERQKLKDKRESLRLNVLTIVLMKC